MRILFVVLELPSCVLRAWFPHAFPATFPACVPVIPVSFCPNVCSLFCVLTPKTSVLLPTQAPRAAGRDLARSRRELFPCIGIIHER
jgi:hypothetical protein